MASRRDFENMIKALPSSDKLDKNDLIEKTKVFWDFQDYITTKLQITETESESISRSYILEKVTQVPNIHEMNESESVEVYISALIDFAKENEFNDCDNLAEGFRYMCRITKLIAN